MHPSPLKGRSILITGGAGAFGQAFARRALDDGARRVVIFSRSESTQAAMKAQFRHESRLRFVIGDVRDQLRIMDACRNVDMVVHAAALKRVEVCEADPSEAIATNIIGTQNVARACVERGVAQAVFLSTDKAAESNTLYGSTKFAAEKYWVAANVYAAGTVTRFSATRYGNVLGSTGSVIPTWRAQAAAGQPLTITDCRMDRFFMSMDQAVDLVVLTLRSMRGGEVFVPKLATATVRALAAAVAPMSPTIETGIRPGEKLHETLIGEDEARSTYDMGTHYIIEPTTRSWGQFAPPNGILVPDTFTYRSDMGPVLTAGQLQGMVA